MGRFSCFYTQLERIAIKQIYIKDLTQLVRYVDFTLINQHVTKLMVHYIFLFFVNHSI